MRSLPFRALALLALVACGRSGVPATPVPEIALLDVNPNSSSFGEYVGPRDHADHVSAWYFGKST